MLSKSSLNAAYPLAQLLAEKGWVLRPIAETPLAQLINASLAQADTVHGVAEDQLETQPCFSSHLMESSSAAGTDGVVAHDQIMQSTVDAVSRVVMVNLDVARNVVNPLVLSVAQKTQEYMAARSSTSLAPLSVVPFTYKSIWDSPILRELVTKYATTPVVDMALQPMGLQPISSLEAGVLTGAGRFDDEINQLLADGAGLRLDIVWQRLFGTDGARTLVEALPSDRTSIDDVLIAFLFARRVQDEIPGGVNLDVSAWRTYASTILAQAGRAVNRILERRELDKRNLNLVLMAPAGDRPEGEIIVVGDNYGRWIEEGGTPEVLFGAVLTDRRFGYRDLLAKSSEYQRVWKSEYSVLQNKIAADRYNFLLGGLREVLTQVINEMPEEQIVVSREELHARLREQLTCIKPKHLEDIYRAARKAVCRVIYGHTNVEQMLDAIDASVAAHPELDIREAALLGTIQFVTSWICKLFTVDVAPENGA